MCWERRNNGSAAESTTEERKDLLPGGGGGRGQSYWTQWDQLPSGLGPGAVHGGLASPLAAASKQGSRRFVEQGGTSLGKLTVPCQGNGSFIRFLLHR